MGLKTEARDHHRTPDSSRAYGVETKIALHKKTTSRHPVDDFLSPKLTQRVEKQDESTWLPQRDGGHGLAPRTGLALVVPPRRLWQCGDVRAREKPVGATSAARGTPAGATSARARSARRCDVRSRRGDTHARGGGARRGDVRAKERPSGRRTRAQGTPVGATMFASADARRGDVCARGGRPSGRRQRRVGAMSCSTGRGDVRAQGTPVGARSARAGGARRRARGKGACDRACSGLPLVFMCEGPPSGLGQGADGRTRRGRPFGTLTTMREFRKQIGVCVGPRLRSPCVV